MDGRQPAGSRLHPRHELVEHYTPDGWLGRLLLATATGSVGVTALFLALAFVASTPFLWPVTAFVASAVGLAGVGLALVVLWPVYLSLIGNVESASAYREDGATPSPSAEATDDPDDAVALLKRRYAAGEVTEEEFERRLDDLLGVDAALDRADAGHDAGESPHRREKAERTADFND